MHRPLHASIDDVLGPRDSRFLGEGFKRVEHALSHLAITPGADGAGSIEATAHLTIPGLWSRKGDQSPRPHLSTIDAMILAAQLTGLYAAHTLGLPPHAHFAVRQLDMKAGSRPDEDDLQEFPVSARLVSTGPGGEQGPATTMDCRIGSLSARVHAVHGTGHGPTRSSHVYDRADELPGPWNDAPYGIAHRARKQLLTQVGVSTRGPGDPTASADVTLPGHRAGQIPHGTPATMIDAFAAVLQLGQVLLYTLDGVDRADSANLWMRRTRVTTGTPPGPAHGPARATASLERARLLPSQAGTWRTAEVTGALHAVRIQAGVTHLLPASWHGNDL
ncbi:AvrD family protein [Streptomyces sp. NBC_01506]|uniref:AvrD family protein n=1 Tax=Streptomyces sp. NBC_01506 TaxID=2903887 RepID=UPI0038707E76